MYRSIDEIPIMQRFQRIYTEFGLGQLIRIVLLLVGLLGMALFGVLGLNSWIAVGIAGIGLVVGWFLRNVIPEGAEYYTAAITGGLLIYGIVLLVGKYSGVSHELQLGVIALTTVIVFNLKYWTLSDPRVVNVP